MEFVAVTIAALLVSGIALYSGFGLGTLLMPVFAIFFPVPVAVASTAVVHLATNVFRVALVGRGANWRVVALFGVPAAVAALVGAFLLVRVSQVEPLLTYHLGQREFTVTVVKLVVALLIVGFALLELVPYLERVGFPRRYVPLGGGLSGFFGGLSGHQGALRSAVLSRLDLETKAFVGTTSVCGFMVDASRLAVYGGAFYAEGFGEVIQGESMALVGAAVAAAFVGTFLSSRLLKKVTMRTVRRLVGVLLVLVGAALAVGVV